MKLPKSVTVGSMRYAVLDMPEEMHELSGAVGLCDKSNLIIHVYPRMALAKQWSTLWHEVIHSMFEEASIDIKEEEEIVSALERIQCAVMKDNPTLVKNLIKVLRDQDNNSTA